MFGLLVAALAAPLLALAAPMELSKRTPGRATYYQVGLGACGQYNVPGDFVSIFLRLLVAVYTRSALVSNCVLSFRLSH